jgi:iron complex outermembrane receptor protein
MKNEFSNLYFDLLDVTNEQGIEDLDYSGKSNTFSPEWTIKAAYEHKFNLKDGSVITARLDGSYTSEYILSFNEAEIFMDIDASDPLNGIFVLNRKDMTDIRYQEGFYKINMSAMYSSSDGRWSLTAYVKNLTDYAEKTSWINAPTETLLIGSPRTIGGILSVRF